MQWYCDGLLRAHVQMQASADDLQRQNAAFERERQKVSSGPLRLHVVRLCVARRRGGVAARWCGARGAQARARVECVTLESRRDVARRGADAEPLGRADGS